MPGLDSRNGIVFKCVPNNRNITNYIIYIIENIKTILKD